MALWTPGKRAGMSGAPRLVHCVFSPFDHLSLPNIDLYVVHCKVQTSVGFPSLKGEADTMERFRLTFKPSECRCYIPLAILGLLPLVVFLFALVTGQLV